MKLVGLLVGLCLVSPFPMRCCVTFDKQSCSRCQLLLLFGLLPIVQRVSVLLNSLVHRVSDQRRHLLRTVSGYFSAGEKVSEVPREQKQTGQ